MHGLLVISITHSNTKMAQYLASCFTLLFSSSASQHKCSHNNIKQDKAPFNGSSKTLCQTTGPSSTFSAENKNSPFHVAILLSIARYYKQEPRTLFLPSYRIRQAFRVFHQNKCHKEISNHLTEYIFLKR